MIGTLKLRLLPGALAAAVVFTLSLSSPIEAAEDKKNDPMQIARGAKAWAQTCNRCHNLRDPKELSDDDWAVSVMHMRVRGNIPGQLARDIAEFLKSSN